MLFTFDAGLVTFRLRKLSLDSPWTAVALIAISQCLLTLFVAPQRDFPLDDDWAYAQVVQSILRGQFHLSEVAGPSTVFHAYWGALWCMVFGFSFTVLTIANLVMGACGSFSFYGLSRVLGLPSRLALIGALTLLLNPLTVFLSYTFQTDLTFLALWLAALWAFAAAWQRPRPLVFLLLGGLFSAAAVLTRQVGFTAPLAAALVWGYQHGVRRGALGIALAAGPPVIAYGLFVVWMNTHDGIPWGMTIYSPGNFVSHIVDPHFPLEEALRLLYVGGFVSFLLLPIFALLISSRRWRPRLAIFRNRQGSDAAPREAAQGRSNILQGDRIYVVLGLLLVILYSIIYRVEQVFNAGSDLLQVRGYLPGLVGMDLKVPVFPFGFWVAVTVGIVPLAVSLLLLLVRAASMNLRQAHWKNRDPGLLIFGLSTLGVAALTLTDALYHDTLALPLLPGLIIFLLLYLRAHAVSLAPAVIALLFLVGVSLLTLRDYYNWHAAAWRAGQSLLATGVGPARVIGSGEWGYWYLWEEAVRDAQATGQPINFNILQHLVIPDYVLSFTPQPNWVPGVQDPQAVYQTCAATPYPGPLNSSSAYIYTLSRIGCPSP